MKIQFSQGKAWPGPPNLGILEEHLFFQYQQQLIIAAAATAEKSGKFTFSFSFQQLLIIARSAGNEKIWQKQIFSI